MIDKDASNDKPAGLSKCRFNYGSGMNKQQTESNNALLDHIGSKFGQSMKTSFEEGETVTTEVDETMLPRFDIEEDMKAHVEGLK